MLKRKANAKHSKLNKSDAQHNMSAGPHRFPKGGKKLGGRKKGTRNKLTSICREDLATCFESLGGVEGLIAWCRESSDNMKAFYTKMWIKLLPVQVKLNEPNVNMVFSSYEAMREELRRTGIPVPERLAPPPVVIDTDVPDKQ
jgi:hypothetical protein